LNTERTSIRVGVNTLFMIPGEVGGTETYLRQTLSAIAEYHPDLQLALFTNRENDPILREELGRYNQVQFCSLRVRAANRYARIVAEQTLLPVAARRARVDLLWSPGYTAPLRAPCPQVVTIPDMQYKTHPEDLAPHYRVATDILVKAAARRAVHIIAISEFTKSEIVRYTSASPERIDVTHLAADPAFAEPLSKDRRRTILAGLLPGGGPYVLCVAHTYPHKNVHALVEAFGQIYESVPHRLALVGSRRLGEPQLQAAIEKLPDPGRVVRLEKLNTEQLRAIYQGADVFVFPSLYEGFGLPVLEAMMAGVPVVTTRRASISEVGDELVVYFDPDNPRDLSRKILDVVQWPAEKRGQWTSKATVYARGFSWRETADRTVVALNRTVKSAR